MSKGETTCDFLQRYIDLCDNPSCRGTLEKAHALRDEIIALFESDIPSIRSGLLLRIRTGTVNDDTVNAVMDLVLLRKKLEKLQAVLSDADLKRKDELEIARLKATSATAIAVATATSSVEMSLSLEITSVTQLSSEDISPEDKLRLVTLLSSLEEEKTKKNKAALSEKLSAVLKFLADSSVKVAVACIPYLPQFTELLKNL